MKINIKATGIALTEAIKDYLNKRLVTLEKLIDGRDESAMLDVEVGKISNHHKAGDIFRTELNLHIARKKLRAESEGADLYATIDEAKDQMSDELRHAKDKKISSAKKGGRIVKEIMRGVSKKK